MTVEAQRTLDKDPRYILSFVQITKNNVVHKSYTETGINGQQITPSFCFTFVYHLALPVKAFPFYSSHEGLKTLDTTGKYSKYLVA